MYTAGDTQGSRAQIENKINASLYIHCNWLAESKIYGSYLNISLSRYSVWISIAMRCDAQQHAKSASMHDTSIHETPIHDTSIHDTSIHDTTICIDTRYIDTRDIDTQCIGTKVSLILVSRYCPCLN